MFDAFGELPMQAREGHCIYCDRELLDGEPEPHQAEDSKNDAITKSWIDSFADADPRQGKRYLSHFSKGVCKECNNRNNSEFEQRCICDGMLLFSRWNNSKSSESRNPAGGSLTVSVVTTDDEELFGTIGFHTDGGNASFFPKTPATPPARADWLFLKLSPIKFRNQGFEVARIRFHWEGRDILDMARFLAKCAVERTFMENPISARSPATYELRWLVRYGVRAGVVWNYFVGMSDVPAREYGEGEGDSCFRFESSAHGFVQVEGDEIGLPLAFVLRGGGSSYYFPLRPRPALEEPPPINDVRGLPVFWLFQYRVETVAPGETVCGERPAPKGAR